MLLSLLNSAIQNTACIPAPIGNGVAGTQKELIMVDLAVTVTASLSAFSCFIAKTWDYSATLTSHTAISIIGGLFAFLLTFRNSESYSRWFEGRGHVGTIMAQCRYLGTVITGASAQLEESGDCELAASTELKQNANRLIRALYRAVILHIRGIAESDSLGEHLSPNEMRLITSPKVGARPLLVMRWIVSELKFLNKELVISDYRATLAACGRITSSFNGADKLANTPNPNVLAYLMFVVYMVLMWWLFPWYLASSDDDTTIAVLSSFLYAYMIGCLIFVAFDMDHPFDQGIIDLPLEQYERALGVDLDMILAGASSSLQNEITDLFMTLEEDGGQSRQEQKARQELRENRFQETKADLQALFSSDDDDDDGDDGALFSDDDDNDDDDDGDQKGSGEEAAHNGNKNHEDDDVGGFLDESDEDVSEGVGDFLDLSLIHISEPTRLLSISYAVFCLKKKKNKTNKA
eukprot:TRINITY_DN60679_c0_g1_i1.p1 TRINITY_DN60679_c0_g1~~TRINITY_DN60679_c0_g1_i1.p1  ORF type:complete len:464 (-),score=133.45 TRINITY_DN60679_c0_g1_i1:86-1477(-)